MAPAEAAESWHCGLLGLVRIEPNGLTHTSEAEPRTGRRETGDRRRSEKLDSITTSFGFLGYPVKGGDEVSG